MQISTKELRIQPGRIISMVNNGQEITITYRGEPLAKIVSLKAGKNSIKNEGEDELFGIWKDREDTEDVEQYIRNARKRRQIC